MKLILFVSSLLFVTPYMLSLQLNKQTQHCEEVWTENQRKVFTSLTFVFQYGIPMVLIGFAYFFIVRELRRHCQPESKRHEEKIKRKENKKLTKLLVIVTTTFAICVLPYHCIALWVEFGSGISFVYIEDVSVVTFFMLYVNSALDPILYNVFSSTFRKEFSRRWANFYRACSATSESVRMKSFLRSDTNRTLLEAEL